MPDITKSIKHSAFKLDDLGELVLSLSDAQNKDEIARALTTHTSNIVDHQFLFLTLLNLKKTYYSVSVLKPDKEDIVIDRKHFSAEVGMPGWVIRNEVPFFADINSAPLAHEDFEGVLQKLGIQSLLIVPLKSKQEIIGTLIFGNTQEEVYTEADTHLAQLVAIQTATALDNISFIDSSKKRLSQLELVNQIAIKITSKLEINELLSYAAETIQKSFNYFDVTIFLLEENRQQLVLVAHSGNYIDFLPHGYEQALGMGIIGWVAEYNKSLLVNDVSLEDRYITYAYHNTKSELAVPICVDNKVVGVINVEDTLLNAFDETDRMVLETLAQQIGSALKNARLYEEVKRTSVKMRQLDQMRTEFLGIVSHDFRSPLSSIILASKSLLRTDKVKKQPRVHEFLKIIQDQAVRLNHLAEEILSLTKLESGQLTYQFKVVNIHKLTEEAIALVKFSPKHNLTCTIDPELSYIKADEQKIRQVIHNLVSNAVKYSPTGGRVTVSITNYSLNKVLVSVSDEGVGIPEDQKDRIFKKFGRIEDDKTKGIKGSGLGLWIASEIIRAHGGDIWFESQPDRGTTFQFTLKKAN